MPKTTAQHTDLYYARVDNVVLDLLAHKEFMQSKRSAEFTKRISLLLNCSPHTARKYISDARKTIRSIGREKRAKAFVNAIRDREYVIRKAMSSEDVKLAFDGMKDRDRLYGLYNDDSKNPVSLKNLDISRLSDEQLLTLKRKIKANESYEEYLNMLGVL